ncbi:MAG: hypothetical protein KJZ80_08345 [Hyphomicrobiaceae bacterium]|nr:hypothetical protein [Hyphomicrobiaceae bacterium]
MTSATASGDNCVPSDAGAVADAGVIEISEAIAAGIRAFNTIPVTSRIVSDGALACGKTTKHSSTNA